MAWEAMIDQASLGLGTIHALVADVSSIGLVAGTLAQKKIVVSELAVGAA